MIQNSLRLNNVLNFASPTLNLTTYIGIKVDATAKDLERSPRFLCNFVKTSLPKVSWEEGRVAHVRRKVPIGTSLSEYLTPHRKIWDPLKISGTMRNRKLKFYTHSDRAKYFFHV